jgi:DNA-binding transcriptional MocR family regulator
MWRPEIGEAPGPRYRAIADVLARDIGLGRLSPGARLPTHRDLADELGVTVTTVSRAYAEAARRGLVSGEIGRGTFVRRPARHDLRPDIPPGVVDLSLNTPPRVVGEEAFMRNALRRVAEDGDLGDLCAYGPNAGWPRHREAGAAWIRRLGVEADASRVVVSTGAQHALAVLFLTLLEPGDALLTEALAYPGMKTLASLLQLRLEGVPLDEQGLRPDALEAVCRRGRVRALYCVPTLQNPTTATLSVERRREIAEIVRRHRLLLIEDDIHGALPDDAPPPLAAFAPELTYYVASTGKCLFPGLRVGYVLVPPGRAERVAAGLRATTWMASPLMAEVAAMLLADGSAERVLQARREETAARQAMARERLGGFTWQGPPHAYHLWLELPDPWRAEQFAGQVRRAGVMVAPATDFVVGRGEAPHAVRVSLGAPADRDLLARALDTIAETLVSRPESPAPIV